MSVLYTLQGSATCVANPSAGWAQHASSDIDASCVFACLQIDDAYAGGAVGQRIAKMNGFYNQLGAGAKPLNNKYPEVSSA